jgi:CDP-paratose 2-epimerase
MRVLVTGGAGFIGANLARRMSRSHPDWEIMALDNLRRRGAELNLDALVECSAEPSGLAGVDGSPDYVVKSNPLGASNCLELARRPSAYVVFLSTRRVYPVAALTSLALNEADTRSSWAATQPVPGASPNGISDQFPLDGARTLYGTTRLTAELLIAEYREAYGLKAVINRCGVFAAPWPMGEVAQGAFTL